MVKAHAEIPGTERILETLEQEEPIQKVSPPYTHYFMSKAETAG